MKILNDIQTQLEIMRAQLDRLEARVSELSQQQFVQFGGNGLTFQDYPQKWYQDASGNWYRHDVVNYSEPKAYFPSLHTQ